CPILGVSGGRNSAPSLVSVGGGIVPHRWCQWGEESCPILGVSGGGIVPHRWCHLGEE
ncbi:unnamed protein product, partial [Staurois parvus]